MLHMNRFFIALGLALVLMPVTMLAAQSSEAVIFSPVKVDGPRHDPANDTYWFGPFSETASVLDVDNDGDLDLVAGRNWYEAPLWIKHENFRSGGDVNGPETENNSEFPMDVDGDGCTDIVSSGWMFMKGAYWYKNPCNKTDTWESTKVHQAFNMEGVEGHHDIDGDGDEDVLVNHWNLYEDQGLTWLEHTDEYPYFVEHVIGREVDMHGNGMGDINMDGRVDFVTPQGWYENPGGEATKTGTWTFHRDWKFESAKTEKAGSGSHPILVHDVNEDGLNDVIIGSAHSYGLAWYEQQQTGTNGDRSFEQHWIETDYSVFHTLALGDLNGDGKDDLVAGKRFLAHYGADVGAFEPLLAFWYDLNGGDPKRHIIFYNHLPHYPDEGSLNPPPNYAFGMGMNAHVVDMNDDGRNDVVMPSKTGLHIFYNQGSPPTPGYALELPPYDSYATWRSWGDYEALFNGEDFTGWVVPEGDGGHWQVKNYMIDYDALSEAEGRKDLFTEEEFCDYNLHVEWRFKEASGLYDMPEILPDGTYKKDEQGNVITTPTPNSDSGIQLRGPGHQANIWNWNVGSGELWSVRNNEDLAPEVRAAAVPSKRMDHPIGEWNEFDIRMVDDRVSVMLNGEWVIQDAQIPGIAECGPIGLQHHGGMNEETGEMEPTSSLIQFRNLWIDPVNEEQKAEMVEIEYPEGWEVLFDGDAENLDGWTSAPGHAWVVEDGAIKLDREFDGTMPNEHYLWTEDAYDDFVLEFEFKTAENTNSGVFLRTSDVDDPVYTGFEMQVSNSYGAEPSQKGTAGTLYDLVTPDVNAVNPTGEWNHARVFAVDNQMAMYLNGRRILGIDLDQWMTAGKNPDGTDNKYKRAIADYARTGRIGLQDHGRPVWYRNIRVKRLDASDFGRMDLSDEEIDTDEGGRESPLKEAANKSTEAEEDWKTLFDGDAEDLDGWIKGSDNAFVVEDSVLTVDREMDGAEHNADYLWTEDTYNDFILELEFKTAENTNSGIFLRTPDLSDPVYTGIEVQVSNSYGEDLSRTGTAGALYDLIQPTSNDVNPPGEWNRYRIIAIDNQIAVELNGRRVTEADLDQWTETGRNPDGTDNKFTRPLKDFARSGHLGLQDHGRPVWYRNIRVKRLDEGTTMEDATKSDG